jgi:hypothetical protein
MGSSPSRVVSISPRTAAASSSISYSQKRSARQPVLHLRQIGVARAQDPISRWRGGACYRRKRSVSPVADGGERTR